MMLWLTFLIPFLGGVVLLVGPRERLWLAGASIVTCGATLAIAILAFEPVPIAVFEWGGPLQLTATVTPLSGLVMIIVPIVAAAVIAYAAAHEHEPGLRRLVGLLVLFLAGMELLLIANDFLTLLIGWEIVGACSWALIGHRWREPEVGRSAIYAFIATRLGDLGLFIAAIAVFAGTGSFGFAGLAQLPPARLALVAAGVILSATAKSGQIPFAPWLFRAMAGPTSVSALLHAATMVAAGAYLLIRLQPMLAIVPWFGMVVIAIGLVTALAGGIVALVQPHAKKLLAASTSAHYGLMFVAIGAGFPMIAALHLVAHALFKSLLFLVAGIAGERAGDYALRHMGFAKLMPVVTSASAIGALALGGVPPLGGAWTKDEIINAAGAHGWPLAILVMVAGALSAAYSARFQLMAFGSVNCEGKTDYRPDLTERSAPALLALASLALGVLWLGGINEPTSRRLGGELPTPHGWAIILSLTLVAVGVGIGIVAARRRDLGIRGAAAFCADWLGLPMLIDVSVTRPALAIAGWAAVADDRIIDAGVDMTAGLARKIAYLAARTDDRVVDGGVRATAGLVRLLSRVSANIGETMTEGLPALTAQFVSAGGRQAVRLQSGMTHHYYALITGGLVLVIALTLLGT
jgi:NADH-quinone oxidoreductase subunit L